MDIEKILTSKCIISQVQNDGMLIETEEGNNFILSDNILKEIDGKILFALKYRSNIKFISENILINVIKDDTEIRWLKQNV